MPLRDHIRPGVRVLFVGINPGIRTAQIGHHFAGYSNRFWKLLHESGLVPEAIGTEDDWRLPEWGFGITNLVARATAGTVGPPPATVGPPVFSGAPGAAAALGTPRPVARTDAGRVPGVEAAYGRSAGLIEPA
jgi:hypothetical protein